TQVLTRPATHPAEQDDIYGAKNCLISLGDNVMAKKAIRMTRAPTTLLRTWITANCTINSIEDKSCGEQRAEVPEDMQQISIANNHFIIGRSGIAHQERLSQLLARFATLR
ncbi:hypothetical protein AbraCBS73388_008664, partial [Aspergillus brasiliensis]